VTGYRVNEDAFVFVIIPVQNLLREDADDDAGNCRNYIEYEP